MISLSYRVDTLTPAAENDYSRFVVEAAAPLSHTLAWRSTLQHLGLGEAIYWLLYRGNHIVATLPAFVVRTPTGTVLNSLPFVQSTGGVMTHPALSAQEHADCVRILIGELLKWCAAHHVNVASVVGSAFIEKPSEEVFPVVPDFRLVRTVQAIDLRDTLKYRDSVVGSIKKAANAYPATHVAHSVGDAKLVYTVYANNMLQIGTLPLSWAFYEHLFETAGPQDWVRFIWAELDGQPVSALILMRFGGIVDYYSVGSTDLGRKEQINSWLCDQQIRLAQQDGFQWWNWMVSPNQQVYDFKKRWGGLDRKYPIWTWKTGDITPLLRLTPAELMTAFPGYYVVPYRWLQTAHE